MTPSKLTSIISAGIIGLGLLRCGSCVPAGHVRVLDTFGNVSERKLQSGYNFPVNPFSGRIAIDTRTKEMKETISVPTNEGLMVDLEISVLYHANAEKADSIYKSIGEDYENVIVAPFLRNVSRDVIADHSSEDLYGAGREKIAAQIINILGPDYKERGIELENVLLRKVKLPDVVTNAIETKMSMNKMQRLCNMFYLKKKEKQMLKEQMPGVLREHRKKLPEA